MIEGLWLGLWDPRWDFDTAAPPHDHYLVRAPTESLLHTLGTQIFFYSPLVWTIMIWG